MAPVPLGGPDDLTRVAYDGGTCETDSAFSAALGSDDSGLGAAATTTGSTGLGSGLGGAGLGGCCCWGGEAAVTVARAAADAATSGSC